MIHLKTFFGVWLVWKISNENGNGNDRQPSAAAENKLGERVRVRRKSGTVGREEAQTWIMVYENKKGKPFYAA